MCFLENLIHHQLLEDFGPDLYNKPRNKFNSRIQVRLKVGNKYFSCISVKFHSILKVTVSFAQSI